MGNVAIIATQLEWDKHDHKHHRHRHIIDWEGDSNRSRGTKIIDIATVSAISNTAIFTTTSEKGDGVCLLQCFISRKAPSNPELHTTIFRSNTLYHHTKQNLHEAHLDAGGVTYHHQFLSVGINP